MPPGPVQNKKNILPGHDKIIDQLDFAYLDNTADEFELHNNLLLANEIGNKFTNEFPVLMHGYRMLVADPDHPVILSTN